MDLVWSEHLSHMQKEYYLLYEDNQLTDVSLFCQQRCLRAHKLVLTACSPYFKEVFRENPCKHATIIMHSVNYQDMASLLEFIYKGQVTVSRERYDKILKIAGELRIKGFEDHTHSDNDFNDTNEAKIVHPNINAESQKGHNLERNQSVEEINFNLPCNSFKPGTLKKEPANECCPDNDFLNSSENGDEELGDHFLKGMYFEPVKITYESFENAFDCDLCTQSFKSRRDLQDHKKEAHTTCEFCHKKFSSVRDLVRHRRLHTGERPFTCDICGKTFPRKDYLSQHIKTYHGVVKTPGNLQNNLDNPIEPKIELKEDPTFDTEVEKPTNLQNLETCKEKRGRGRPRKEYYPKLVEIVKEKRSRGRPRKYPVPELPKSDKKGRGRGRPRKETCQENLNFCHENDEPMEEVPQIVEKKEDLMIIEPIVEINTYDTAVENQRIINEKSENVTSEKNEENNTLLDVVN